MSPTRNGNALIETLWVFIVKTLLGIEVKIFCLAWMLIKMQMKRFVTTKWCWRFLLTFDDFELLLLCHQALLHIDVFCWDCKEAWIDGKIACFWFTSNLLGSSSSERHHSFYREANRVTVPAVTGSLRTYMMIKKIQDTMKRFFISSKKTLIFRTSFKSQHVLKVKDLVYLFEFSFLFQPFKELCRPSK